MSNSSPSSLGRKPSFHLDVSDDEDEVMADATNTAESHELSGKDAIGGPISAPPSNKNAESYFSQNTQTSNVLDQNTAHEAINSHIPSTTTSAGSEQDRSHANATTHSNPTNPTNANTNPTSSNIADGLNPTVAQQFSCESLYSYSYTYDTNSSLSARLIALKRSIKFIMAHPSLARDLQASLAHVTPPDGAQDLPSKVFSTIRSSSTNLSSLVNNYNNGRRSGNTSPTKTGAPGNGPPPSTEESDESIAAFESFLHFLDDAITMLPDDFTPSRLSRAVLPRAPSGGTRRRSLGRLGIAPVLQRSYSEAEGEQMARATAAVAAAVSSAAPGAALRSTSTMDAGSAGVTTTGSLQEQLMDALTLPYMDVANTGYKLDNSGPNNSNLQSYANNNNSSMVSLAALSKSVSSLNLAPLAVSTRKVPGQAFAITPLQPVSSKYALSHAIFTTEPCAPYRILSANDMACLVFGISQADVRSRNILSLVNTQYHAAVVEQVTAQMNKLKQMSFTSNNNNNNNSNTTTKQMVLICGELVPTVKGNGAESVASVWLRAHHGCMVWVLEEVVADKLHIEFDTKTGQVVSIKGDTVDLLVPQWTNYNVGKACLAKDKDAEPNSHASSVPTPKTGLRISDITNLKANSDQFTQWPSEAAGFQYCILTARPTLVLPSLARLVRYDEDACRGSLLVTSLPLMAGVVIVDNNYKITDYNHYFLGALLGYSRYTGELRGHDLEEILPDFASLFDQIMVQCHFEQPNLSIGMVIPEQMFRRVAASRSRTNSTDGGVEQNSEKKSDNEGPSLPRRRPSLIGPSCGPRESSSDGMRALTIDGDVIFVDVQLRVISSNQYALWISYSRAIHSFHANFAMPSQLAMRTSLEPSVAQKRASDSADYEDDHEDVVKRRKPREIGAQRREKTLNDYQIIQKLGEGAYGKVLLVRYPTAPYDVVIMKCVIKERILVDTWTRDKRLGTIPNEIRIMNTLNLSPHPNIVRLIDFFEDDEYYHIEMERHGDPGTDLFDLIELRPDMDEKEGKRIFVQVVSAVRHLHSQGIVHRDIKDENIVVDDAGIIKLIDFGSAAFVKQGPFDVFMGTLDYAAPEVLSGKPYDGRPQDVWALGILLYTIIYKENPFYSVDEIMEGELRVPFVPSKECLDLISMILNRDVRARPSIDDICAHPWIAKDFETA